RRRRAPTPPATPLKTTFRAFRALAQRGRGGVYQALDLSVMPPRLCILKEGREAGEVRLDGRDGSWRVRHEGRVLAALREAGVEVPRLYSSFRAERNCYIAVEFIEGESLDRWLGRRRRRLAVAAALGRGAELARLVARIHAAGWIWRDCKPGNVVLTKRGGLRPLDFEGACPVDSPDPLPWGTPAFMPPEGDDEFHGQPRLPEDLYALGAVIYFLLAGRPPDAPSPVPLEKMRRDVPDGAREVVAGLLAPDPCRRPGAAEAARKLEAAIAAAATRRWRAVRASG
ncbi:MAG TPA: lipopolysaccharide kinase InaA family protein, partial [Pyrinomonadaceae bacterium]|nr:lipopolysaccharide kinase InaA family protein [Pyrinomonadaceae bacterium]